MAMRDECKQSVANALGKASLTIQEAKDIEARIRRAKESLARKDRQAFLNMSEADRLIEAGKMVAADIKADQIRKNATAAKDIIAMSRNLNEIQTHPTLPAMEVVDRMIAMHGDMSGIQSINTQSRAIASLYKGQLVDFYTKIKGGLGVFTDNDLVQAIVRERFGENTGNPLAKKISDEFGTVFDSIKDRFNRSGGNIRTLENWALPQTHDALKLLDAGKAAWVDYVLPRLDTKQYIKDDGGYFTHDELKKFTEDIFSTIATDGANKTEIGKVSATGIGSKVTNRHSESRALHFKDADAWIDYQNKFGGMQFSDLIESHINGLSKEIAMVERLGSNPQNSMRILMDAAEKIDKQNGINPDGARKRNEVMFRELTGGNTPQSEILANLFLAYRSLNVASMLGGTTLASLTDQAMIYKTAKLHGMNYSDAFGELVTQLNPKNKADRELAHSLGLGIEEMTQSVGRWADDGLTYSHGKAEKLARVSSAIATQVLRASGLNALTAANKIGFSKILMNKYGNLTRNKKWSDLTPDDKRIIEGTGLNEKTWEVMTLADPIVDRKGNKLMSARSIYEIPDDKLKHLGDPKAVKDEAATRFQAHILDEQGFAVIEAGLRERTFLGAGMQKGTIMGEVVKSMLQFKSFAASFLMRQGSRSLAQPTVAGKWKYGASLFAMLTVMGGLVVQLREIAKGNDPLTVWDENDPSKAGSFFVRSAVQGGGLSIAGDILVAGTDTTGRGVDGILAGPFGSDVKSALGLTVGNLTQYYDEKDTNAVNEAFKLLKSKTPAQNLWYTKAATDRLFFDEMQDMLAPGYREKMNRKAEKKFDRSRWLGDDIGDVQAPNFEKVIQ